MKDLKEALGLAPDLQQIFSAMSHPRIGVYKIGGIVILIDLLIFSIFIYLFYLIFIYLFFLLYIYIIIQLFIHLFIYLLIYVFMLFVCLIVC